MKEKQSCVYEIVNVINSNRYIGSTVDFDARSKSHLIHLARGDHVNTHLQRAFDLYGKENFEFRVLENITRGELSEREQFHIDSCNFDSLYNVLPVVGSRLGVKHKDETRAKISESLMGHEVSAETRAKMSKKSSGRVFSAESTAKRLESRSGYVHSAETKEKMSYSAKNRKKKGKNE